MTTIEISDDLQNLKAIHEMLPRELNISIRQLYKWAQENPERRNFPQHKEQLGRLKLYSAAEVIRWCILWKRATAKMGNVKGLRNQDG